MRRLLTLVLTVGVAALIAVAAVDALRGGDPTAESGTRTVETVRKPPAPAWLEGGVAEVQRLAREGVRGTLYLSADGCLDGNVRRLRALSLPTLEFSEGPRSRTCSFTVSADGDYTAGAEAVWSPQDPLFASATGPGELTLIDPEQPGDFRLAGSAPAFQPDGTFTHVRAGRVVEWTTDCADASSVVSPAVSPGPDVGPYCWRPVVSAAALRRPLPPDVRLRSVDALAWLSDFVLVAVLDTRGRTWVAVYENGRPRGPASPYPIGADIVRADPAGGYLGILAHGFVEVYDRDGRIPWGSSLETRAFDWSPQGSWLAYATSDRVYLVRTSDWTTQFRLPLSTESLAWRQ
jgi:hypothetical protein